MKIVRVIPLLNWIRSLQTGSGQGGREDLGGRRKRSHLSDGGQAARGPVGHGQPWLRLH